MFQSFNAFVGFLLILPFHNGLDWEVNNIQIWGKRAPRVLEPNPSKLLMHHFLDLPRIVRGRFIQREDVRLGPLLGIYPGLDLIVQRVQVDDLVDLDALRDHSEGRFVAARPDLGVSFLSANGTVLIHGHVLNVRGQCTKDSRSSHDLCSLSAIVFWVSSASSFAACTDSP